MQTLFGRGVGSTANIEFWESPDREGWLMKQGLSSLTPSLIKNRLSHEESIPRGTIPVRNCLSIKGAEETVNKPNAFELTTTLPARMFFIADSDKEKEDWINAIGRAIVRNSYSMLDKEQEDYTTT